MNVELMVLYKNGVTSTIALGHLSDGDLTMLLEGFHKGRRKTLRYSPYNSPLKSISIDFSEVVSFTVRQINEADKSKS